MNNKTELIKKIVTYALFVILGVFIALISLNLIKYAEIENKQNIIAKENEIKKNIIAKENLEKKKDEYLKKEILSNLNVQAKAFQVKTLGTDKILFQKNEEKILGIASLTKMATSIVSLNEYENDTEIEIKKSFLFTANNHELISREIFNSKDLTEFMFIVSSNIASLALSYGGTLVEENHKIFLEKMNDLAEKIGMKSTIFFSDSGLDVNSNVSGSYSTAKDISKLIKYLYEQYPDFAVNTAVSEKNICSNIMCHEIKNTNPLLNTVPGIKLSKTGWTKKAQGNLALIYEFGGQEYSIVILNSTKEGRFADAEQLIFGIQNYVLKK